MQELKKILEEIESEALHNSEIGRKQCEGMAIAMNIIRNHVPAVVIAWRNHLEPYRPERSEGK